MKLSFIFSMAAFFFPLIRNSISEKTVSAELTVRYTQIYIKLGICKNDYKIKTRKTGKIEFDFIPWNQLLMALKGVFILRAANRERTETFSSNNVRVSLQRISHQVR